LAAMEGRGLCVKVNSGISHISSHVLVQSQTP
jgi:hypothetical protein